MYVLITVIGGFIDGAPFIRYLLNNEIIIFKTELVIERMYLILDY